MIDLEAIRARNEQQREREESAIAECVGELEHLRPVLEAGNKITSAQRADIDALLAEVERLNEMVPGRWFRVMQPNGKLWCETSDEEEAREASKETGWPLERLFVSQRSEWRPIP